MQSDDLFRGHGMTTKEAEQTLSVIRALMERGTRYTHISSASAFAAGLVTLAGCAVRSSGILPFGERGNFVATWVGVFVFALAGIVAFTAISALRNGEPVWNRQARTVALSILPAFFAAIIVSQVFFEKNRLDVLPGIWMLFYGVGALAMSFFTPYAIRVLGIAFMVAGGISLLVLPGHEVPAMALSFGGIHLGWALAVSVQRQWEQSARRAVIAQER